ncbi:LOW QUALITY PROTEIN: coiled-coil domain-containing protein 74B [Clarias gariepinus]
MQPTRFCRKGCSCKGQKPWSEVKTFESEREFYLEQMLEDSCLPQDTHLCTQTGVSDDTSHTSEGGTKSLPESTGGLITSLNPLRIHSSPTEPPRAPTLRECEVIIRQLNANICVFPQILRIKAVLRDIVFNRKITPESYIMAKTYVADEKSRAEEPGMFPTLPFRVLPKAQ